MGVDCPDVETVIHWGSPRTMEGFFQQSGRAGRRKDLVPHAYSIVYFQAVDIHNTEEFEGSYYSCP